MIISKWLALLSINNLLKLALAVLEAIAIRTKTKKDDKLVIFIKDVIINLKKYNENIK